jgi:hypothetical protein
MTGENFTNPVPEIFVATSQLSWRDHWDHFLARWGVNRNGHRIPPGLYALGKPGPTSPVFVTANYTLSFDALRSALCGIDGYILVLNTHGVNVWCAAAKGTFGTQELVQRIESSGLRQLVHRKVLILPQLGAAGVAAHEVKRQAHFKVEYGPVRAADLPQYLKTRMATPEMRRVTFTLKERIELVPVELVHVLLPTLAAMIVSLFVIGPLMSLGVILSVLAGVVLFPILLPWLPSVAFSSKGFILGGVVALPLALIAFFYDASTALWWRLACALQYLLCLPPVTAFLALNFTGSTPLTSRSSVKREMRTYLPIMAVMLVIGVLIVVGLFLYRKGRGIY